MLVSKYFGVGILAGIGQKVIIDYFSEIEKQVDRNILNRIGDLLNFNPLQQNNHLNNFISKTFDTVMPVLTFGNCLSSPAVSVLLALSHILVKYAQIAIKSQNINPLQKKTELQHLSIGKWVFAGLGIAGLLVPMLLDSPE